MFPQNKETSIRVVYLKSRFAESTSKSSSSERLPYLKYNVLCYVYITTGSANILNYISFLASRPSYNLHCKNTTLHLRDITINSVVRVGNYLDRKETMCCTNNYTLKQIDTLYSF